MLWEIRLVMWIKTVVANVLRTVLLTFSRRQHLGLQRGREVRPRGVGARRPGAREVQTRGVRRGDPSPLRLFKNPRVARVDGLDGRRCLYPGGFRQVFGLKVLPSRGPLGARRVLLRQVVGPRPPAREHRAARLVAAAVLRRAARAPARGVRVVPERQGGPGGAAGRGEGEGLHSGRRVRQQRGRVAREVRRVVRRGGKVQAVVGGSDEPALRGGGGGLLALRGEQAAAQRDAAVAARAAPPARVEAGLGVSADELVLQEGAGHGVARPRDDLCTRRVARGGREAVDVAARVHAATQQALPLDLRMRTSPHTKQYNHIIMNANI